MSTEVSELAGLTTEDAGQLIGQTIVAVKAWEFGLSLTLSNGAVLEIEGHTYSDAALSVGLTPAPAVA